MTFLIVLFIVAFFVWYGNKGKNGKKNLTQSKQLKCINPRSSHNLSSAKFNIEQHIRIYNDSIKLVTTTVNPEVYFSRYKLAQENLNEIVQILSVYGSQLNVDTNYFKNEARAMNSPNNKKTDKFITRVFQKLESKIDVLATDKGKINNIIKTKDALLQFSNCFSDKQIERIEFLSNALLPTNALQEISANQDNKKIVKQDIPELKTGLTNRWNISISFGKSTSKNFPKALYLAKNSDEYVQSQDGDSNDIFQAIYFKENYLEFQRLYKLIGSWKSTFIFINGHMIDSKSLGKINICYGDKLKFNDPLFCYGASEWTSNPFGCHRLMLTPSQTPWWSFGKYDSRGNWIIDKEEIRKKIIYKSKLFMKCPAFNLEAILDAWSKIPKMLSPKNDRNDWLFQEDRVYPLDYNSINKKYLSL